MPGVRIINTSFVPLPSGPYPPPGNIIPLSFLDARWIYLRQPVQNLLLYSCSTLTPSNTHLLKKSLTQASSFFHPLAGKLTYQNSTNQLIIDASSPDCGVNVIEAESDFDVYNLITEDTINNEAFKKLVPCYSVEKLPTPVLAIQITKFVCGGFAVGTALHHAAMDGVGLWRFVETWARICRGNGALPPCEGLRTSHDREVISHPRKAEIVSRFLRILAPDLPQLPEAPKSVPQDQVNLARRTFILDHTSIQSLKQRASIQSDGETISTPSATTVISAHIWVSLAKTKRPQKDNFPTSLWLLVDLRSHFQNPNNNNVLFTGNCIRGVQVKSTCQDLAAPNGLTNACTEIARAVKQVRDGPLDGIEKWPEEFKNGPDGLNVRVAGSARWGAYEIDFGWGKPGRVELVSMNFDGEVSMFAGREQGSVQVTVALAEEQMEMFARTFVSGLAREGQFGNSPGMARL